MLENWFEQNGAKLIKIYQNLAPTSVGKNIQHVHELEKGMSANDIVILSDTQNIGESVRKQLWKLHYPWKDIQVIDLGIVRNGSLDFIKTIFHELIHDQVRVICISENNEIIRAYLSCLAGIRTRHNLMHITSRPDTDIEVFDRKDSNTTYLGVQGHISSFDTHENSLNIRLGEVKDNVFQVEPFCRNQDVVVWDIQSMKYNEFPGHSTLGPAGIDAEEMTQISRYLGFNDKLKGFFIKGFEPNLDKDDQGAKLIAQCIWYYLDALNLCTKEDLHHREDFIEYVVDIDMLDDPIVFIKGKKTGRWWFKNEKTNELSPCSENDYKIACMNDIPARLLL